MVRTFLVSVVFHCSFASNLHPFYYWFSPLVQGLAIPRSINKTRKDSFKAPLISKLSVLSAFFQRTSRKEGALENVLKATKWRTFSTELKLMRWAREWREVLAVYHTSCLAYLGFSKDKDSVKSPIGEGQSSQQNDIVYVCLVPALKWICWSIMTK
jgi:hypothetical protein